MSSFEIGATIKRSFKVVETHWTAVFSISLIPILAAVATFLVSFVVQVFVLTDMVAEGYAVLPLGLIEKYVGTPLVILLQVLNIVSVLATAAFILNWQSFLILGRDAVTATSGQGPLPEYLQAAVWRPRFKKYLLRSLYLLLLGVVVYILGAGLVFLISHFRLAADITIPVLFFFAFSVGIPFFSRLLMVFPLIAGDAEDSSFMAALVLTKGMGWRIFLMQLGPVFIICAIILAAMLVLALVLNFLLLLGMMMSAVLIWIVLVVVAIAWIPFMLVFSLIISSPNALIYLQLVPEHAARWAELGKKEIIAPPAIEQPVIAQPVRGQTLGKRTLAYGKRKSR